MHIASFRETNGACADFIACYGRIIRYSATEAVHAINGRITSLQVFVDLLSRKLQ
jgi:hypothetical protein